MQRLLRLLCVSLGMGQLAWSAVAVEDQPIKSLVASVPSGVNLFFTDDLLDRMKSRIERAEWARAIWQTRLQAAREWVALKMEIPKTGGGYFHDYACPDDGARLRFDPQRPHDHFCPKCKRYLQGPQLDAYWVATVHANNFQAARTLALNASLFNKSDDARWAKEILLYYARHYADYPVHGNRAGKGKIFFQSLDESVHLLDAAAIYELLARRDLSPDEARAVREQLFRPAAALVRQFALGVHNIQCWHSAFLLTAALICDDRSLRDEALANLATNLTKGITPDGWWFEGSPGYHFYTLSALGRFAIPAKINHSSPPTTSRMTEMLVMPFRVAYPDFNLPVINDSGETSLASLAPYLETATYLFDDPTLVSMLARLYETGSAKRTSFEALCYGPDSFPKAGSFVQKSERLDHAGMAILRRPATDLYALLRSGRYQGGHDHPDRLNLIVYGLGQQLAPDLGTCGYGLPLVRWYRSTVAHNTLVVDEQSQDRRASDAEIVFFHDEPAFSAAAVRATKLYPGVEMTRTVVALDDALIDYCRVRSAGEHTMDWVYHNVGRMATDLPATTAVTVPRYSYLEGVRALKVGQVGDLPSSRDRETGNQAVVQWQVNGGRVVVTLLDLDRAEFFTARGPGFPGEEKLSLVIARRRGPSADFATVIQIVANGKLPCSAAIVEHSKDRVVIQLGDGAVTCKYELAPDRVRRLEAIR